MRICQRNGERNSNAWEQVGADIDGEAAGDYSDGASPPLTAAVAIGAIKNDGTGSSAAMYGSISAIQPAIGSNSALTSMEKPQHIPDPASHFRLTAAWSPLAHIKTMTVASTPAMCAFISAIQPAIEQLGADIDGEAVSDSSGYSISLSGDGNTVAIGARIMTVMALFRPCAHLPAQFENSGNNSALTSMESCWRLLGHSVSLSAGSTVAIGAAGNDGNGSGSGHVRIYRRNSNVIGRNFEVTSTDKPHTFPSDGA